MALKPPQYPGRTTARGFPESDDHGDFWRYRVWDPCKREWSELLSRMEAGRRLESHGMTKKQSANKLRSIRRLYKRQVLGNT